MFFWPCIIMYHNKVTFCWPCSIMYHNNFTNTIHFHFHNTLLCLKSSTCFFRASSFHLQEALHQQRWCVLRAVLDVGRLGVNSQPANIYSCTQHTPKLLMQCLLNMYAWRLNHVEDLRHNKVIVKWKCITLVTLLWFFNRVSKNNQI
jgi:hypothetical protein